MLVLIIISLASSDFERLGDPWDYHDSVTKFFVKGGYVVEVEIDLSSVQESRSFPRRHRKLLYCEIFVLRHIVI